MIRSGTTTGVHATAALLGAHLLYAGRVPPPCLGVRLACGEVREIPIEPCGVGPGWVCCSSIKADNDDLDVTKGCQIVVHLSNDPLWLPKNPTPHSPHALESLFLYAGVGVGVATKKGLRVPVGFPAITPGALSHLAQAAGGSGGFAPLHASIGVTGGELIAQKSANAQVGVVGGLSILGTTGRVQPLSHEAYFESIRVELSVLEQEGRERVALALGQRAKACALLEYEEREVVEVGNFIAGSCALLSSFSEVCLFAGVGKMAKIAQGIGQTHNRFGGLDWVRFQEDLRAMGGVVDPEAKTVRGVLEALGEGERRWAVARMEHEAARSLHSWLPKGALTRVRARAVVE